jgi:hypothetical protein
VTSRSLAPEAEFRALVDHLLETVGSDPVLLGVVSGMVLGNNVIERVSYIAERVEDMSSSGPISVGHRAPL